MCDARGRTREPRKNGLKIENSILAASVRAMNLSETLEPNALRPGSQARVNDLRSRDVFPSSASLEMCQPPLAENQLDIQSLETCVRKTASWRRIR